MNEQIKSGLLQAIAARTKDTFEVVVNGLKHFVSSEGEKKGLYIGTINRDGKEFKIYMI